MWRACRRRGLLSFVGFRGARRIVACAGRDRVRRAAAFAGRGAAAKSGSTRMADGGGGGGVEGAYSVCEVPPAARVPVMAVRLPVALLRRLKDASGGEEGGDADFALRINEDGTTGVSAPLLRIVWYSNGVAIRCVGGVFGCGECLLTHVGCGVSACAAVAGRRAGVWRAGDHGKRRSQLLSLQRQYRERSLLQAGAQRLLMKFAPVAIAGD